MRSLRVVAVVLIFVSGAGCSSAPQVEVAPGVTIDGKYMTSYEGPEAIAEIQYRLARYQLGEEWLYFKLSLASAGGTVRINRESVRVRAPDGKTSVLIDQSTFREIYGSLQANLGRSNVWSPPTDRFISFRRPCEQWLLTPVGAAAAMRYQSPLILNANRWCTGPVVFQIPGGVQPGIWKLLIEFEETEAEIPFVLEE